MTDWLSGKTISSIDEITLQAFKNQLDNKDILTTEAIARI